MSKNNSVKVLAGIIIAASLTACGGSGQVRSGGEDDVGPYPTNWKSIVKSYIQNNYLDPRSVTHSEAAPPFRKTTLFYDFGWMVCIRNNAKNQFGGYTGRRITELGIKRGRVVDVDDKSDLFCRDAKFEPLPLD
jgi:hypothetical protein